MFPKNLVSPNVIQNLSQLNPVRGNKPAQKKYAQLHIDNYQ